MKKSISTIEEKADIQDVIKKLKKYVSEGVRRVDSTINGAGSIGALFLPQAVAARGRLREVCEKAILTCVNGCLSAQAYEDVLWKKVYYDTYSMAKKMRKDNIWSSQESGWLWAHLNDGLTFYHYLLHTYAISNKNFSFSADFLPVLYQVDDLSLNEDNKMASNNIPNKDSVLRTLTCLGDLARYTLDLPGSPLGPWSYLLSIRYYHQYLHYNSDSGLIHCNLANVYSSNNEPLMAALHYLRALTCDKSFESADMNLKKMLEKSHHWLSKQPPSLNSHKNKTFNKKSNYRFLHTSLQLISCLISKSSTEEVATQCQDVLYQLGNLLDNYDDPENLDLSEGSNISISPSDNIPDESDSNKLLLGLNNNNNNNLLKTNSEGFSLTPDTMTVLCGVFIVCVQRLKKQGSPHTNMAEVFLASVLLTLVNHVNGRLEQRISLIDPSALEKILPSEEKVENDKEKANDKTDKENQDKSNPEKTTTKKSQGSKLSRIRRRKKPGSDLESSDDEDGESIASSSSSRSSIKTDGDSSDSCEPDEDYELDMSQLCSSEDDDSDYDIKIESDQEWEGLTSWEHLQLISQEGMLASIYVICKWLCQTDDVMTACIKTADSLWISLARLLNMVTVDLDQVLQTGESSTVRKEVLELIKIYKDLLKKMNLPSSGDDKPMSARTKLASHLKSTPLPEDMMLSSVIPSHLIHSSKSLNLKGIEMELLRLVRFDEFGSGLGHRADCPVWHNSDGYVVNKSRCQLPAVLSNNETNDNKKVLPRDPALLMSSEDNNKSTIERGQLTIISHKISNPTKVSDTRRLEGMQSLTKQWLQHEVQNLEERTSRKATLGLYLVPDSTVLINHLPFMKQLLAKPSHMIIIPQIVIDSLDELKKESIGARDAIRWLEVIFRHGSRFLRAQRGHERTHLPLIKYPKRKDKEAWNWYQIVECCNYLGAQIHNGRKSSKTSTVTLLTGETIPKLAAQLSFSPSGVTQAAGAGLQHIDDFMQKWQISTKGHS